MTFTTQSMQEIITWFTANTNELEARGSISFETLNPDLGEGYAGENLNIEGKTYVYRGYKSWTDLAELLICKMLTPEKSIYPLVKLRFEKLETQSSFHLDTQSPKEEKYGIHSSFSQINKMEEPAFLHYYSQALHNAKLSERTRILNLGINTGDEFLVIKNTLNINKYKI